MTSNEKREGTEERIMTEPIDFIDLTEDSPVNRVLRLRNRNSENVTNQRTTTTRSRRRNTAKQQQTMQLQNSVVLEEPDKSTNVGAMEIIDLDETVTPEHKGTCYVNDSVGGSLVVLTCPICFEELSPKMKPTSTRCGHIFCAQCLELAIRNAKQCPTCKTGIKLKTCTRLYF